MNITLILTGKNDSGFISEAFALYEERVKRYINLKTIFVNDVKNTKSLSSSQLKEKEGEVILKNIIPSDYLILLDEKGKEFASKVFADFIQLKMNAGIKNLVFIVGGAYGFSNEVYKRADMKISLSKMTFPHQLVRVIFMEQLYRAFSILKNEKYHHE